MSEEVIINQSDLPEWEPETIEEVDKPENAVKTFDDLWRNLMHQHRTKYDRYETLNSSLSSMNFDDQETRVDFTELNELRDENIINLPLEGIVFNQASDVWVKDRKVFKGQTVLEVVKWL